jgi:hypothetical protein
LPKTDSIDALTKNNYKKDSIEVKNRRLVMIESINKFRRQDD